jgi:hypothetical protein
VTSKRRNVVLVAVAAALVIPALWVLLVPSGQGPVYQRHHLSFWVEAIGGEHYQFNMTNYVTARAAIRSAGSNATPYLLKWIQHEEPARRRIIVGQFCRFLPERFFVPLAVSLSQRRAVGASDAFGLIRTNAGPTAVATLPQLAANKSAPQTAARAAQALALIGPAGVPAIADILQTPNHPGRLGALVGLEQSQLARDSVPILIPVVLACLTDTNTFCSISARHVLGGMDVASDSAVIALTAGLHHPDAKVRQSAAKALSRSRGPAQTAVPMLMQLLSDQDFTVRQEATNTLREIAPEALTNAPPTVDLAAQARICFRNLRAMDAAKHQWALVKDQPDAATPSAAALLEYLGTTNLPVCPGGGTYQLLPVDQFPRCSVTNHNDNPY